MYFDIQRQTKAGFGDYQTIVSNLDYRDAVPFIPPQGFQPQHGIIAKWFGLGQMIKDGMEFPIMMHDHDVFVRAPITHDEEAICSAFGEDEYISDQIIIIPEKFRNDVLDYIDRLSRFDFQGLIRTGYGSEVRHEGRYSSEMIQLDMIPRPFARTPNNTCIRLRDLVSFDIQGLHSLDHGDCDCNPIPDDAQAVHGHLNKGRATAALMGWLSK